MHNVIKHLQELVNEIPELKRMIEEDDKWKEARYQRYLDNGIDEQTARKKMREDYWNMVKERDGVEFSINKLT